MCLPTRAYYYRDDALASRSPGACVNVDTYNNNNIPTMCVFVELENDCKKYVKKRRFGIRPWAKQIFGGNSRVPPVPSMHSDRLIKQPQTRHVYALMPLLSFNRFSYSLQVRFSTIINDLNDS